jgi:hypothetical protein
MAQVVSCQSLTEEAGFNPRSGFVAFKVDTVVLGQIFFQALLFSLSVSFHHCSITFHSSTLTLYKLSN